LEKIKVVCLNKRISPFGIDELAPNKVQKMEIVENDSQKLAATPTSPNEVIRGLN